MKRILTPLAALAAALVLPSAYGQTTIYTDHTDLNVHFTPNLNDNPVSGFRTKDTWSLNPRDDDAGGVEYAPGVGTDSATLFVSKDSYTTLPTGYGFTGASAGDGVYLLPQSQDPNLLYLGFAGYGVPTSLVDKYNPSVASGGRVTRNGAWVKVGLSSVTGLDGGAAPGQFSVFQNGFTGPNVFMSTADGISHTPGAFDDSLWIVAGGHIHYNFTFTQPGDYLVNLTTSLYYNADGNQSTLGLESVSAPQTMHFRVEAQPVPEPASFAALGLGALAFLRRRRKA